MPGLSLKQQAFVREYLISGNASDAHRKAGYAGQNHDVNGPRMLGHAGIAAAIAEGRAKIVAKAEAKFEITLDRVLDELGRIAFGGMSKFLRVNADGDPMIDLSACTPADLDLLSEATVEDFTDGRGEDARNVRRIKIKPIDRMAALLALGKHLGLSEKTKEESVDRFAQAMLEIANGKASAMPIGTDDDDVDPLAPVDEEDDT